ncbi:MAG: GGDEF domain-containing protein, partial [Leptotrichiaceae bacterium]|nr:GGDEF domain-containing protein [Leptotrichiaceae bacterium]
YNTPFIILLMDIDFFKRINDTYGHNTGDAILKSISKIILTQVRTTDIVARWGGEEFICLLPNTALTEGHIVANRIRNKIEKENFPKVGKVTLSIGVAENVGNYSTIEEIINNADIALYSSKQNGRNRVSLWQANNDIEI